MRSSSLLELATLAQRVFYNINDSLILYIKNRRIKSAVLMSPMSTQPIRLTFTIDFLRKYWSDPAETWPIHIGSL